MRSLEWVDLTYIAKHRADDPSQLRPMYYSNLVEYKGEGASKTKQKKPAYHNVLTFVKRYAKRGAVSMGIYLLTYLPYIGP